MPAPSGIKLRDSCDSCAASKVKCSKDKPSCNRCMERGVTCQYLVTQKTGRKMRRRDLRNDSVDTTSACQTMTPPLSLASPCSPQLDPVTDISMLDSQFSALDTSTPLYSGLEDFLSTLPTTSSFDNLPNHLTSPDYTNESYVAGNYALNPADIPFPTNGDSLFTSKDMGIESLDFDLASLASAFPTAQQPNEPQTPATSPHSNNLELALRLMAQLSSREDDPSLTPSLATPTSELQTVINKNKQVMETVNTLLQSPCSPDGYCLVVVCLVVSKVLSTYAAAAHGLCARETTKRRLSISASSSNLSAWSAAGEPQADRTDPMAAQRVLDELYRVQASVDQLGAKMQLCTKRNRTFGGETFGIDSEATLTAFPFSATVLDQLYAELRKRLSTLSLELIDELKRYWA
ncbi:hypothetical protein BDV95DRAFT_589419 [Massariosphaeria phaeospora]|uniref:Zn(2)-C6 fungal-type domain-containing protein n=1 Tax=Massariosphaeria phaeospora TaxID=100035 RepID=A0A7C8IK53_9PLEO|nr:hypothetical protein BDV95DRAFT_589419 [Massariosphaeria phaeospora]